MAKRPWASFQLRAVTNWFHPIATPCPRTGSAAIRRHSSTNYGPVTPGPAPSVALGLSQMGSLTLLEPQSRTRNGSSPSELWISPRCA